MYVMTASPPPTDAGRSREPAAEPTAVPWPRSASAGAGLVHAAAAGSHSGDHTLALLFAVTAAVQLGWAAVAVARPLRATLAAGIIVGAAVAAWALSRTVGLPLVESLREVEAVGTQDLLAAILGAVAVAAAGPALVGTRPTGSAPLPAPRLAPLALPASWCSPSPCRAWPPRTPTAASHGDEVAAGAERPVITTSDDAHAHTPSMDHGAAHKDMAHHERRIISIDDPRLTPSRSAAARDLFDRTIGRRPTYTDEASVVAAGYESIGDSVTGVRALRAPHLTSGTASSWTPSRSSPTCSRPRRASRRSWPRPCSSSRSRQDAWTTCPRSPAR